MPEPILNETTTDVDGTEPGEVEIEGNSSILRARSGQAFDLELSAELEVLVTHHLGVKLEPFFEREAGTQGALTNSAGIEGSLSWKLLQDFAHDFHVQGEASGRVPTDVSTVVQPGESPLPLSFDLRSGFRRGPITLRSSFGVSAGGEAAHLPVHGSMAVFTGFDLTERFGFFGVEADADGARADPVLLAFDLVPDLTPLGLPFAVAFVLPYSVGADAHAPSYGFFVRLFIESEREQKYERTGHPQ
jgi:hypothetical protein